MICKHVLILRLESEKLIRQISVTDYTGVRDAWPLVRPHESIQKHKNPSCSVPLSVHIAVGTTCFANLFTRLS